MNERIEQLIDDILQLPDVDDVYKLSKDGGIELIDGRWLVPLNIYLRKKPQTGRPLGIFVEDIITTGDKFGA